MTRRRLALDDELRLSLDWWSGWGVESTPAVCADGWESEFARWDAADEELGPEPAARLYSHLQRQGKFVCRREHDPRSIDDLVQAAEVHAAEVQSVEVHSAEGHSAERHSAEVKSAGPAPVAAAWPDAAEIQAASSRTSGLPVSPYETVKVQAPPPVLAAVVAAEAPPVAPVRAALPTMDDLPPTAPPPRPRPAPALQLVADPEPAVEADAVSAVEAAVARVPSAPARQPMVVAPRSVERRCLALGEHFGNRFGGGQDLYSSVRDRRLAFAVQVSNAADADQDSTLRISTVDLPGLGYHLESPDGLPFIDVVGRVDLSLVNDPWLGELDQLVERLDEMARGKPTTPPPADDAAAALAEHDATDLDATDLVAPIETPAGSDALDDALVDGALVDGAEVADDDDTEGDDADSDDTDSDDTGSDAAGSDDAGTDYEPGDASDDAAAASASAYPPGVAEALDLLASIGNELASRQDADADGEPDQSPTDIANQLEFFRNAGDTRTDAPVDDGEILPPHSALRAHIPDMVESIGQPPIGAAPRDVPPPSERPPMPEPEPVLDISDDAVAIDFGPNRGSTTRRGRALISGGLLLIIAALAGTWFFLQQAQGSEPEIAEQGAPTNASSDVDDPPVVTFTQCSETRAVGSITNTFDEPATFEIVIDFTSVPGAVVPASLTLDIEPGVTAELSAPFGAVLTPGIPIHCSGTVESVDFS